MQRRWSLHYAANAANAGKLTSSRPTGGDRIDAPLPETEDPLPRDDYDTDGLRVTGKLGMWEKNLRTGSVQWSRDTDDLLGLPPGAARRSLDVLLGAIAPEEQDEVRAALQGSVHTLDHHQVEYRWRRPDGRELLVRNEWSVQPDEEGKPAVMRGVLLDVTHRTKARRALSRQTELLEMLYSVAALANEAATLDRALLGVLARVCAFGGWPAATAYRISDHTPGVLEPAGAFHVSDPVRFEALRAAVSGARVGRGDGGPGLVLARGEPAWTHDLRRYAPLSVAEAAMAAGLRAVLDLPVLVGSKTVAVIELFSYEEQAPTGKHMEALALVAAQLGRVFERERSAKEQRASEARLEQILESMPIGVYVMDAEGRPTFANRYALAMRGSGPETALVRPYGLYVAGTEQPYPDSKHPLFRALAGESSMVADMEFRPRAQPGEPAPKPIPIEISGSPVFDERGRVAYGLVAFYDISERKKIERMKDEFISVVSHELRTPLASIQGAIGLLENGVLGDLGPEALEMARIAGDGSRRLLRLVNDLLDIQKLESSSPSLHPGPLQLAPILERVVAASKPYATTLSIRVELDDEAAGVKVLADADRLAQVVQNLVSNALKYTPPGERVRVAAARRAGRVRVAVEDRGPGVPEAFRKRLFQKFSQADASDARQKTGTGLGLAICRAIVEKLGGTIAYEPHPDGGARFYFELPELEE